MSTLLSGLGSFPCQSIPYVFTHDQACGLTPDSANTQCSHPQLT